MIESTEAKRGRDGRMEEEGERVMRARSRRREDKKTEMYTVGHVSL